MMIAEDTMNTTLKKTLLWTPRIAGILFVLFISLFAFDVFEAGLGFWGTLLALFMHLLPSLLLAIAIYVAWKREWVGAGLFIGWAIWYVVFFGSRDFPWITYFILAGIPTAIGLLFLADWIWRKQIRTS
jgi:hypothetical protein